MIKASGTVRLSFIAALNKDIGAGSAAGKLPFSVEAMLGSGAGNGQINLAWWGKRTLAPLASEDLVLTGGLIDALGQAAEFSIVKGIYIATNRGLAIVGDAITESGFPLAAGDVFMTTNFGNGWPVAEGGAIRISNNDAVNSATYEIAIIGLN